jgi:hypothetical protein
MNKRTIPILMAAAGISAAGYYAYNIPEPPLIHHASISDKSTSMAGLSCKAMVDAARAKIENPNVVTPPGSTFSFLVTGSSNSKLRARLVLSLPIPSKTWSPAGGGSEGQGLEEFYKQLEQTCEKQGDADASAIYDALRLGLNHLQGLGCGTPAAKCSISVMSDGIENADRAMYAYLTNSKAPPPNPLPNRIAAVDFCGIDPGIAEKWADVLEAPANYRAYCEAERVAPNANKKREGVK